MAKPKPKPKRAVKLPKGYRKWDGEKKSNYWEKKRKDKADAPPKPEKPVPFAETPMGMRVESEASVRYGGAESAIKDEIRRGQQHGKTVDQMYDYFQGKLAGLKTGQAQQTQAMQTSAASGQADAAAYAGASTNAMTQDLAARGAVQGNGDQAAAAGANIAAQAAGSRAQMGAQRAGVIGSLGAIGSNEITAQQGSAEGARVHNKLKANEYVERFKDKWINSQKERGDFKMQRAGQLVDDQTKNDIAIAGLKLDAEEFAGKQKLAYDTLGATTANNERDDAQAKRNARDDRTAAARSDSTTRRGQDSTATTAREARAAAAYEGREGRKSQERISRRSGGSGGGSSGGRGGRGGRDMVNVTTKVGNKVQFTRSDWHELQKRNASMRSAVGHYKTTGKFPTGMDSLHKSVVKDLAQDGKISAQWYVQLSDRWGYIPKEWW